MAGQASMRRITRRITNIGWGRSCSGDDRDDRDYSRDDRDYRDYRDYRGMNMT